MRVSFMSSLAWKWPSRSVDVVKRDKLENRTRGELATDRDDESECVAHQFDWDTFTWTGIYVSGPEQILTSTVPVRVLAVSSG